MPKRKLIEVDLNIEGKQLVNEMTNWQRTQWAKKGYPGLSGSNYDPDKIKPFLKKIRNIIAKEMMP